MAIKKLGSIVNFFGLKGMLKVSISTSQVDERFKIGNEVIIKNEVGEDTTYKIKSLMKKNDRIIMIGLEGFDDINQIQWMIGKDIFADVKASKGRYFFDDLVGMKVLDKDNNEIGAVTTVTKMPAGDYLVVNDKIYIPFLIDKFIANVDKKTKKIVLTELGTEVAK